MYNSHFEKSSSKRPRLSVGPSTTFVMGKAATSRARGTPFPMEHVVRYGLKPMECHSDTGHVVSVRCRFCVYFGREDNHDPLVKQIERTKTDTRKAWTGNWRVDLYQKHHRSAHPSIWEIYQTSSHDDKVTFFDNRLPFKATIFSHVNVGPPLQFDIKASIVDTIVGEMFFHPDDYGGVTRKAALNLFQKKGDVYQVTVANPLQFQLVVSYIARGVSFRQCEGILADTRKIMGTSNHHFANLRAISHRILQRLHHGNLC